MKNSAVINGKINCHYLLKEKTQDFDENFARSLTKDYFFNMQRILKISPKEKATENHTNWAESDQEIDSEIDDILKQSDIKAIKEESNLNPLGNNKSKKENEFKFKTEVEVPPCKNAPLIESVQFSNCLTPHHKVYSFAFPEQDIRNYTCLPYIPNLNKKYALLKSQKSSNIVSHFTLQYLIHLDEQWCERVFAQEVKTKIV